jgi:hypothetical protein
MRVVKPVDYGIYNYSHINFTTICSIGNISTNIYQCPDGVTNITQTCNGTISGIFFSRCPIKKVYPTCHVLSGDITCKLLNFTSTNTQCRCSLSSNNQNRRYLTSNVRNKIESIEIVSLILYEIDIAGSTFKELNNIHNFISFLKGSIIVFTMFSVVWGVGLSILIILTLKDKYKMMTMNKIRDENNNIERNVNKNQIVPEINIISSSSSSNQENEQESNAAKLKEKQEQLRNYIQLLLPKVYSGEIPLSSRIFHEIKQHHKYLGAFFGTATFKQGKTRMLAGIQLLTLQTFLMFMIAFTYDIDVS